MCLSDEIGVDLMSTFDNPESMDGHPMVSSSPESHYPLRRFSHTPKHQVATLKHEPRSRVIASPTSFKNGSVTRREKIDKSYSRESIKPSALEPLALPKGITATSKNNTSTTSNRAPSFEEGAKRLPSLSQGLRSFRTTWQCRSSSREARSAETPPLAMQRRNRTITPHPGKLQDEYLKQLCRLA